MVNNEKKNPIVRFPALAPTEKGSHLGILPCPFILLTFSHSFVKSAEENFPAKRTRIGVEIQVATGVVGWWFLPTSVAPCVHQNPVM